MGLVVLSPKFMSLLVDARDNRETGKLYAYYRDDTVIHIGTLFFNKGQLCGCKYDKVSGLAAIKKLIRSAIATAMFVRTQKSEIEEQPSMPNVDTVISNLMQGSPATELVPCNLSGTELQQAVSHIMGDILGNIGEKNVQRIASRFPPEQNASIFVDQCISMAANFVGKKRARALIEPLIN